MAQSMATQPRLAGGPGNQMEQAAMISGGPDSGAYVKWALLLQDQLEKTQNERAWIVQQCLRLQAENQQLRLSLFEENPTKFATHSQCLPMEPRVANSAAAEPPRVPPPMPAPAPAPARSASSVEHDRWVDALHLPPLQPASDGKSPATQPATAATATAAGATSAGAEGASPAPADMLNTPNLRLLASFLDERDDRTRGTSEMSHEPRVADRPNEPRPTKFQRTQRAPGRVGTSFDQLASTSTLATRRR